MDERDHASPPTARRHQAAARPSALFEKSDGMLSASKRWSKRVADGLIELQASFGPRLHSHRTVEAREPKDEGRTARGTSDPDGIGLDLCPEDLAS